jgi:amino acid transporter
MPDQDDFSVVPPSNPAMDSKVGSLRALVEADFVDERYKDTQRGLSNRHVQMIALGGAVGTGLFVGSGQALAIGGPLSLLLDYGFISVLDYGLGTVIAEIGPYMPVHGGTMSYDGFRYVSRSLAFAIGYLYYYSLGIMVLYEITAASLVIDYWSSEVSVAVWITIMLLVIVFLNFLHVRAYGETEFWFSALKITALFRLLVLSFILYRC